MTYQKKVNLTSFALLTIGTAILSGCSASSSRYGDTQTGYATQGYSETASYTQSSRYGDVKEASCGYDVVQCGWNVEWVAIPTWYQVQTRTPIIETPPTVITNPPVIVQEPCPEGTYPSATGDTCLRPTPVVDLPPVRVEPPVVPHYPSIPHTPPTYLPPKK